MQYIVMNKYHTVKLQTPLDLQSNVLNSWLLMHHIETVAPFNGCQQYFAVNILCGKNISGYHAHQLYINIDNVTICFNIHFMAPQVWTDMMH
jgi:hypothetical protein